MPIFIMFFSLCLSRSRTDDKNTIRLVRPDTEQLVYWATDIPKQSCCGSSSPGSCAGTSSATTECSHHSKFRTSRTRRTSRSASTARRLLVIDRFLATTTARLARPMISCLSRQYSGLYLSPTLPTLLPASNIPDRCTIGGLLHNYRNPPPTDYFHIFPTIRSILRP